VDSNESVHSVAKLQECTCNAGLRTLHSVAEMRKLLVTLQPCSSVCFWPTNHHLPIVFHDPYCSIILISPIFATVYFTRDLG